MPQAMQLLRENPRRVASFERGGIWQVASGGACAFLALIVAACGPRLALNPATLVGDDQTNIAIEAFLYSTIDLADNAGIPTVQFDADEGTKAATSAWNSMPFLIPLRDKIHYKRATSPPIVDRGATPNPADPRYRLAANNYIRTGSDAAQLICSNYMSGLYDRNSYFEFLQRELSVAYGVAALTLRLVNANGTLKDVFAGGEPLVDQGLNAYKDWRYLKIGDENLRPLVMAAMQQKTNYYLVLLNNQSMTFGAAVNAVNEIEFLCTRAGLTYLINHGLSQSAQNVAFDRNTGAMIFRTPANSVPPPGDTPPQVKAPAGLQGAGVTKFSPVTDLGMRIRAFARTNIKAVTDYLALHHNGMPMAEFVRMASPADQLKMIQELNIP